MAQITEHFSFEEMTYTGFEDLQLLNRLEARKDHRVMENLILLCEDLLEPIREHFKLPVQINSGYRCFSVNEAAGGSKYSQHMSGAAADFCIPGVDIEKLWEWITNKVSFRWHQAIFYPKHGFVHISLPTGHEDMQIIVKRK